MAAAAGIRSEYFEAKGNRSASGSDFFNFPSRVKYLVNIPNNLFLETGL